MLKIISFKYKISLLLATSILILGLGYLTTIRTYQNQLTAQIKKLETLTTKNNSLYDCWLKYTVEKPNFDLLEKQYAETEQFFPTFTLPEIIASLSQAAAQTQVVLTSIKPEINEQKNMLQIFPVTIALNGHYQQIINFINLIAEHSYFMVFNKIIMQPEANSLTLQATLQTVQSVTENKISPKIIAKNQSAISALIYSQQSGITARRLGASGRSVFGSYMTATSDDANNAGNLSAKSITKLRDPFNNEGKTLKVADITRWPSSSLTFLGVYNIANKNWAIVTDPNGFIYQVTIGDRIGSMQSQIIAIDKNTIETTNAIDNVYRSN